MSERDFLEILRTELTAQLSPIHETLRMHEDALRRGASRFERLEDVKRDTAICDAHHMAVKTFGPDIARIEGRLEQQDKHFNRTVALFAILLPLLIGLATLGSNWYWREQDRANEMRTKAQSEQRPVAAADATTR